MKFETKETIVTDIVAYLSIKEARLINNILEKNLESLNCCGAFSYEDLKSYNKIYSPEAINYYVTNDNDNEAELLDAALWFLTRFTSLDNVLQETSMMYEYICNYKDITDLSTEEMEQLINIKKSTEILTNLIKNKATVLDVVEIDRKEIK